MNEIEKVKFQNFCDELLDHFGGMSHIECDVEHLANFILDRERALVDRAEKAEVERDTWINSMSAYGATELKREFDKLTLELSEARKALEDLLRFTDLVCEDQGIRMVGPTISNVRHILAASDQAGKENHGK